ncbi:MAG: hypothetical protein CFE23_04110 [Flavobacterium sp. BFFFF1]|uniref:hypothetical protein n=1 Tax=Flavobacterium sp. BFFFF1 TaxID=2015557 RepID=UPI000BD14A2E|nr:hypothetical protein [Flavobacterium sp. BFFFF1]OYU81661.1 MAG: hypothetical protein CFE23_04110 [Flavobacterium sp. BFFFF1]
MKTKKIIWSFLLVLVFATGANAQKKQTLTDEEQVQEAVTNEINTLFTSKEFLKVKAKKFADVKGTMVFDVGVVQNGKVSTFFKVDSDIKNIDFINWMSDYILDHKFFFKLQKQQRYKVRYNAIFE